jgi:drug/metabolite transporter (DMT)-like permease
VDRSLSPRAVGIVLALVSASSFGALPVLTKVVYAGGAEPIGVLAFRFTLAGLLLLALARWRGEQLPRGRALGALALLGGVGYLGQSLGYFFALERISAGLATLLLYVYPALVVLLSVVLLGTRPRPVAVGCVAVAVAGTALTAGPVGSAAVAGVLLGLGSALAYAFYVVLAGRVLRPTGVASGTGPLATSAVVMCACGVVYDALAVATRPSLPSTAAAWTALLAVALVGTVLAVAAFFAALVRLGPSDTSVVSAAEPVVSVAVAALALGERLGPLQGVGGVLVLTAVVVLARQEPAVQAREDEVPA